MINPDPVDVTVGARVRALREIRRLTQTALGEAVGVSFQQVQKYERGANRISVSALFKIAGALDVSPADLLGVVGPAGRDPEVDGLLVSVRDELARGRRKFPDNELKALAFGEEAGELVKAVLDEPAARVRKEAVQAAASALRLAIDGDSTVDAWRERHGLDALGQARLRSAAE